MWEYSALHTGHACIKISPHFSLPSRDTGAHAHTNKAPIPACHLAVWGPRSPPKQIRRKSWSAPNGAQYYLSPVVHPHPSSSILILLSMPGIQPLVFIGLSGLSHLRLPTHSSRFLSAILVSYPAPFLSITASFIHKHALFARLLYTFLYNSQNFLLYLFPVSLENKLL